VLHPILLNQHRQRLEFMEKYERDSVNVLEDLQETFDIMIAGNAAARTELIRLHRASQIEDEVLHNLERDLDIEEMQITFQRGD